MPLIEVTTAVHMTLDGDPGLVVWMWTDPAGQMHSHWERLDQGATLEEVDVMTRALKVAVNEDPW